MKIGLLSLFQGRTHESDAEMYEQELDLALDAERMGFDSVMVVEHHFTDYAMCPDNTQVLSYLAAKTSKIALFPAAFILPWHDPIRVAEKAVLLDHLSGGRTILGMGRGLARREFASFRIDMSESRDRYDEAAGMILNALETGFMDGEGKYYGMPRTEIRPRPLKSFKGRSYMVGGSPASLETAAHLGLEVMQFGAPATEEAAGGLTPYRDLYRELHDQDPQPIITGDLMVCDRDAKRAEEYAREYQADYWYSVMNHYELLGHHFEETKGAYSMYAQMAEMFRNDKNNEAADNYVNNNLWGDPPQIIEQIRAKYETYGGVDLALMVSYSDMPYDLVRSSLRLFVDKVLPEIQSWEPRPTEKESVPTT